MQALDYFYYLQYIKQKGSRQYIKSLSGIPLLPADKTLLKSQTEPRSWRFKEVIKQL